MTFIHPIDKINDWSSDSEPRDDARNIVRYRTTLSDAVRQVSIGMHDLRAMPDAHQVLDPCSRAGRLDGARFFSYCITTACVKRLKCVLAGIYDAFLELSLQVTLPPSGIAQSGPKLRQALTDIAAIDLSILTI